MRIWKTPKEFAKLAYYLQHTMEYSIVAFHPILPCKKCESLGLKPSAISDFNTYAAKLLMALNVKGPRRFVLVECNHVFKTAEDKKKMMPDGMHLSRYGHVKWAECYSPQLNAAYDAMKHAKILNYKVW